MPNFSTTIKLFLLRLFETDKQEKVDFFKISLSILSTIIILVLINFFIILVYPDNSEALKLLSKELIIKQVHIWISPEPVEQIQILTTIILVPLLIFCNIKLFSLKFFSQIKISDSIYFLNVALWFFSLAFVFYLAFKFDDPNSSHRLAALHHELRIFIKTMISELRFLITIIIFPLITYFIFNGIPKQYNKFLNWSLTSVIVFFLLGMFFLSICNRENYFGQFENLNAALYPVSQVQQGRAILIDFSSQYGLYAHFLYPFFKLINVNVVSFSVTMAGLTVISYSLILFGLRKIISNSLVVFLSFIAILYFSFYSSFINEYPLVRYSYSPIRMIFPALILFLGFSYILNPRKLLYALIIFLSSLSMLWNFDSGIVCFFSFYIYILYEKLAVKNLRSYAAEFMKHTFISASILSLAFLLFSFIMFLQYDNFPNWNLFLKSTQLFGLLGFLSFPMAVFHSWNLVFLVYLYGIYIGLNSVLLNNKKTLDSAAFFVAIFGFGTAIYYLNKSVDSDFFVVMYPCFILLAIFLSKLLNIRSRANLLKIKNFLSVLIITFVLVTIFIQMLKPEKLINKIVDRTPDIISNTLNNQFLSDGVELIKLNTNPNDQVVILLADENHGWINGAPDSVLYLETRTSSPFPVPGSQTLLLKTDLDILNQSLANNISSKVFIDFTGQKKYHPLMKIIDDNYYLDSWLGNWRMYVPKKD